MQHDPGRNRLRRLSCPYRQDRAAIEALIADDFRFTSPLDNRLDRRTYFARCWPTSETVSEFYFVHLIPDG